MTVLDDDLLPAIKELIDELGKLVTFEIETAAGVFDPATGIVGTATTQSFSVLVTPPARFKKKMIDGDLIKESDFRIMVAAQDITLEPELLMKVTVDTQLYTGLVLDPIYTGESIGAWIIRLRK